MQREKRYNIPSFATMALDGGEWSNTCLSCFTPRKELLHPLNGNLNRCQSWSGCLGKGKNLLLLPGIKPPTLQPTA
jgi:hypothetical protein